jgi:hypothetical protein
MHGSKGKKAATLPSRRHRQEYALLTLPPTETHRPHQEQDQPAPLPPLSPDRRTTEEEVEEEWALDLNFGITA